MKVIEVNVKTTMTDDVFETDGIKLVNAIKSGAFQRETKSTEGILECKATVKLLNQQ